MTARVRSLSSLESGVSDVVSRSVSVCVWFPAHVIFRHPPWQRLASSIETTGRSTSSDPTPDCACAQWPRSRSLCPSLTTCRLYPRAGIPPHPLLLPSSSSPLDPSPPSFVCSGVSACRSPRWSPAGAVYSRQLRVCGNVPTRGRQTPRT